MTTTASATLLRAAQIQRDEADRARHGMSLAAGDVLAATADLLEDIGVQVDVVARMFEGIGMPNLIEETASATICGYQSATALAEAVIAEFSR